MRTVCVNTQWASVRREGRVLLVAKKDAPPTRFRVSDLDQLVLMGNITLTPSALDLIMEKGVDTVFLTSTGRYRGRILSGTSSNVTLRLAQFEKLRNGSAFPMARAIVMGKCNNSRVFLQRFIRRHGPTPHLDSAVRAISAATARAQLASTLDEVRGCEGSAAAAYFRAFDDLLKVEGFHFNGRNRRPPMDPVNALLSFCYTLLFNTVESLVRIVGLDPFLGALHAPKNGRPSLVCDLVEEFRAPVVDALIVSALNKKRLHPEDFEDAGPGEPVIIKREAIAVVLELFNARLASKTLYSPQQRKLTYRDIIEQQIRHLARCFLSAASGDSSTTPPSGFPYIPFTLR